MKIGRIKRESRDYCDWYGIGHYTRVVVYKYTFFKKIPLFTYIKKQYYYHDFYTEIRIHPPPANQTVKAITDFTEGIVIGYRKNYFHIKDYQKLKGYGKHN